MSTSICQGNPPNFTEKGLNLEPGEQTEANVRLSVGPEYRDLPAGHVERAQIRVTAADLADFNVVPIRGYRPIYIFGFVPPERRDRDAIFEQLRSAADRMSDNVESYSASMEWSVEKPPTDVAPAHPAGFRCPECRSWLAVDGLYVYHCYSRDVAGQCELHGERKEVDTDSHLFRAMLHNYHTKNANIARQLALGWLRTGEERLANRSMEILSRYESFYRDLPRPAPNSMAFQSRFCGASLFERHFLQKMIDAWVVLHETDAGDADKLQKVAEGLLADSLHITNNHYYSFSASQIDIVTQTLRAALALDLWPYAADAIGGDIGVQRILQRSFDADGVPIDGGDYARQAARQIMTLADSLRSLGIGVAEERLQQIERNCRLLGYLPRPDDFEMETAVLDNTGFTILVNGEGPARRRATINWGSARERGGHDRLTTVLYDAADGELLQRTRRVMWGHPHAYIAFQSFAQNIPVVDEGNIARIRLNQEYLSDDSRAAGVIISDYPERPAYPDTRLKRSLVLFNGCLLVIDRIESSTGERQFDFPINGLRRLEAMPGDMTPFEGELGEPDIYRLPFDLHVKPVDTQPFSAAWSEGDRGVRMHMLGDDFRAFAGKTYTGHGAQSVERDFLMLRHRGEAVTATFLYEATHEETPHVTGFEPAPVMDAEGNAPEESQALPYDVSFDDGRVIRVLISLDSRSYSSGDCEVNMENRISVREADL